jgi:uncharacterized membrane protein YozB (DUF420 family)
VFTVVQKSHYYIFSKSQSTLYTKIIIIERVIEANGNVDVVCFFFVIHERGARVKRVNILIKMLEKVCNEFSILNLSKSVRVTKKKKIQLKWNDDDIEKNMLNCFLFSLKTDMYSFDWGIVIFFI